MNDFINQFPYSDFHELNLDWLIKTVKKLSGDIENFKVINSIKYEGAWTITKEYEIYSIVTFNNVSYLSIKPVPAGIDINDLTYWIPAGFPVDQQLDSSSYNPIANRPVTLAINNANAAILAETNAREADIDLVRDDILAETTARTQADLSLGARIDNIITPVSVDSELIDIRTDSYGTTYDSAGDAVRALEDKMNAIERFRMFDTEYVRVNNGRIDSGDPNRCRSDYLVCPENVSVTYTGETNHASVAGIAFYDKNKQYISGYANNEATIGNPVTVTSPAGTRFAIISTRIASLKKFLYTIPESGISVVAADLYGFMKTAYSWLDFVTTGTNRSQNLNVTPDLLNVSIADPDYQVALWYDNGDRNTTWLTDINIGDYPDPVYMQVRRADNGTMAVGEAAQVCKGYTANTFITYDYLASQLDAPCYVDGDDGDDSNNGLGRSSALRTISAALARGFKNILIKPGTYAEVINVNGKNGLNLKADKYYSAFSIPGATDNPLVIVNAAGNNEGIKFTSCDDLVIEDIKVINADVNGFAIDNCDNASFIDCFAEDIGQMGFKITDTNGTFTNCECHNIGTMGGGQHHDGFNIHGTGTTNFINCSASYCEDDGISHHDACYGFIDGGEWHHCGKGGVASPTHGAVIDVRNIYSHHNRYGVYCHADQDFSRRKINMTNCACKNNSVLDIYVNANYNANIWNCIYSSISSGSNVNIIR